MARAAFYPIRSDYESPSTTYRTIVMFIIFFICEPRILKVKCIEIVNRTTEEMGFTTIGNNQPAKNTEGINTLP